MIRFALAVLGIVLLVWPSYAEELGPNVQIPTGGTLRGRFIEEHTIKKTGSTLRSEGHFVLVPGTGMIWNVEQPLPLTLIVTRDGLREKLGNIDLPTISTEKMPVLARATDMISNALMGKWPKLDKDFVVQRSATPSGWRAVMTARPEAGIPFQSLTADGARFVNTAVVLGQNGGTDNLSFSDQVISADPPTPAEATALAKVKSVPAQ